VKWALLAALSMSLVLPGCSDADRDLPRPYRRVEVPTGVLGSADARSHGRTLFVEHCALCHGERGDGQGVRKEGLTSSPRNFMDPAWHRSTSPRHVFYSIREGLTGTPMPNWKSLSEQDGWDLTAYVLSLGEQP